MDIYWLKIKKEPFKCMINVNKGVILNVDSTSKMSHHDYHLLKQKT